MIKRLNLIFAIISALFIAGCGATDPRPAPPQVCAFDDECPDDSSVCQFGRCLYKYPSGTISHQCGCYGNPGDKDEDFLPPSNYCPSGYNLLFLCDNTYTCRDGSPMWGLACL